MYLQKVTNVRTDLYELYNIKNIHEVTGFLFFILIIILFVLLDEQERIQRKTFVNWINSYLR